MMAEDRKNRRTNDRDAGEHNNMPENILLKRRAQNEKVVACGCKWFRLLLAAPRPQRPHLFFGDYRVALRRAGAVAMAWPVAKAMQIAILVYMCAHTHANVRVCPIELDPCRNRKPQSRQQYIKFLSYGKAREAECHL